MTCEISKLPRLRSALAAVLALPLLAACGGGHHEEAVMVDPSPTIAADAAIAVEAAPVAEAPKRADSGSTPGRPRAGVLTAGDIDDALNFNDFRRYLTKAADNTRLPYVTLKDPILLQINGPSGAPAPGARITLRRPGAAAPFYDGYAGVDGRVSVLPGAYEARLQGRVELRAYPDGQGEPYATTLRTSGKRQKVTLPFASDWQPDFMDLVFVVDTTGSMGDELRWLTKELKSVVRSAKRVRPDVNIRYGLVVYRDHGDAYVVRNYGFTSSEGQMQRWLRKQNAAGGGDYPEAAAEALTAAAGLNWRRGKGERILFHIADAPTHRADARAYLEAAGQAAENGVQIFGLGASGVADEAEYLMRQAAAMTEGRYLFLTDDSGVGYAHAEPKIACYQVQSLKGLVSRVLASELSGRRVEAPKADIIREVGSYRRGVCRQ